MKRILTVATIILLLHGITASAQSWQWGKRMGSSENSLNSQFEDMIDMTSDSKGNVYTLSRVYQNSLSVDGHALTGRGSQDILISSFRCDGTYRWSKIFGTSIYSDRPTAIRADGTNGVYILGFMDVISGSSTAGYFDTDTSLGPNFRSNFLIKYDTAGNYKWLRRPQPDTLTVYSASGAVDMDVDALGNAYLLEKLTPGAYASGSFVATTTGVYVLKYNSAGQCTGGIQLPITVDNLSAGLAGMKIRYNSSTSQYVMCGQFGQSGSLSIGSTALVNYTGYIAAFSATGSLVWLKNGTFPSAIYDRAKFDNSNNIYVAGSTANGGTLNGTTFSNPQNAGGDLPFAMKLNGSTGANMWVTYPKTLTLATGKAIDVTNGKVLFGGAFGDKVVFSTDSFTNTSATGQDCYVVQLDANTGAVQKTATLIGSGFLDNINHIIADKNGNFYVGGQFESQLTVGSTTLSNAGGETDIHVSKFGIANCNCALPSPNFTSGVASGKTVSYTYNGTTTSIDSLVWDFGDGQKQKVTTGFTTPLSHTFTANGKYNVCVTAYNSSCGSNQYCKQTPLTVSGLAGLTEVKVYPNPANNHITIEGAQGATATITNSVGQQAMQVSLSTDKQVVDISSLPAGMYILQLTDTKGNRGATTLVKN